MKKIGTITICILVLAAACQLQAKTNRKPNVLIIYTDDHRYTGVHALGKQPVKTPNLDKLADTGVAFTRAYLMGSFSGATCIPSRAMLHTGRNLFQLKGVGHTIPPEHTTMGEAFMQAGYHAHFVGKWHQDMKSLARSFHSGGKVVGKPRYLTDQFRMPFSDWQADGNYRPEDCYLLQHNDQGKVYRRPLTKDDKRGPIGTEKNGPHVSEVLAEEAADYIQAYDKHRPLFMYLAFPTPHDPRQAPQAYHDMYPVDSIELPPSHMSQHPFDNGHIVLRDEKLAPWPRTPDIARQHLSDYYAIITHLDAQIGRVVTALEKRGLYENKHKHELLDDFKLEKFDAAQWAALFKRSGAKFAGPVAWHGSGMLHWDSDLTKFNTVDMGPGIDLIGELKKALYARDLKLITSYRTGYWYQAAIDRDNPGRLDPRYEDLYGPPHDLDVTDAVPWKNHIEKQSKFSETHMQAWLAKMNEAITKYQPDIAWVDTSFGGTVRAFNTERYTHGKLMSEEDVYLNGVAELYQRQYIAHLFNTALEHDKDVAFVYKEYDVPPGIGMRNVENGLLDELTYDTWMTDIDMCQPVSWFYKEGGGLKSANLLIDMLVDVTAKNGILLLNVPPKPDGTFAEPIVNRLYEIGDWLAVNGEAIYGTMPWTVYGEGPSSLEKTGHYSEKQDDASYTKDDFRFTQKHNALYAICLGIPTGDVTIRSLGSRGRLYEGDILSIELLGCDAKITYEQHPNDMTIQIPQGFTGKHACVF